MLKSLRLTAAPFVMLLALMSGCSAKQIQATSPIASLPTKPTPIPTTSSASSILPLVDSFQDASDKAISAATVSQSAQSKDDWNLVFGMWQEAINLMKAVPKSSSNYVLAQKKVTEYQRNSAIVRKNAEKLLQVVKPASVVVNQNVNNSPKLVEPASVVVNQNVNNSPKVVEPASQKSISPAPAQSSQPSGTPAAREFLEAYFQATVNEGSKGHEYWCSKSALLISSLFAPRGWQILKADNNYGLVRVDSSNKGGSQVTANWSFYLNKETDPKHTGLPRGLCINLMFEQ